MTPEELPAFFASLDGWTQARNVARTTVRYGDHDDQILDLYGSIVEGADLIIVIHGGFWRSAYTRRNTSALAMGIAEAGLPCANVEYRRLGGGTYEALLGDVASARERLDTFERVVAVGHSAGGQLALWLAAEGLVDAAVALGGVCDLGDAFERRLGDDAVGELLGGSPDQLPQAYALADPAARLPLGRPHVLAHGIADDRVPIEHARQYAARARAAGDDCVLVELDADHFQLIDPRSATWPDVLDIVTSLTTRARRTAQTGAV